MTKNFHIPTANISSTNLINEKFVGHKYKLLGSADF